MLGLPPSSCPSLPRKAGVEQVASAAPRTVCALALLFALGCGGGDETAPGFRATDDDRTGGAGAGAATAGGQGGVAGARAPGSGGRAGSAAPTTGGQGGAGGVAGGTGGGSGGGGSPVVITKKGPPYPIVLAHGFFGFEKFAGVGFVTYFYKVKEALAKTGETLVFTPAVDPFNSSEVRGAALAKAIEEILATTGHEKVNLIGHSQGGLDARVVAHDHPELVASVLTVAAPHRGSEVADVVLGVTGDDRLADLLDALVQVVAGPVYGSSAGETSLSSSLDQLSTAKIKTFNETYTDRGGVVYLSVTGRSSGRLAEDVCASKSAPSFVKKYALHRDPIEPLLAVSALIVEHGGDKPSDGLVTVESAKWGEFLGCVPADHFDEIGHLFNDSPGFGNGFDYQEFYAGLVGLLRERGL